MQTATVERQSPELAARQRPVSPLNGVPLPVGRRKGTPNRATRTIKEAIEAACQPGKCHPKGLAGWLVERAQGGIEDRKIFAAFVAKAIPAQLQANVQGGIVVALPWLAGRSVGGSVPPTSQSAVLDAQLIDSQAQLIEDLRVVDPTTPADGAGDPPSPPNGQAGGGG